MEKYIKTNGLNEIIDVFFSYQKNKFDGTEILIEENVGAPFKHKINNKYISNEYGIFIFKYISGSIVEKTPAEIEAEINTNYLPNYIVLKLDEIRTKLYMYWPDSSKTISALKAQYDVVKTASSGWSSISDVDTAYDNFITFMDLS